MFSLDDIYNNVQENLASKVHDQSCKHNSKQDNLPKTLFLVARVYKKLSFLSHLFAKFQEYNLIPQHELYTILCSRTLVLH
jgi:hypothetical protein